MSWQNLLKPLCRLWRLLLDAHGTYSLLVMIGVPILPSTIYLAVVGGLKLIGVYLESWSNILLNSLAIGMSFVAIALILAAVISKKIAASLDTGTGDSARSAIKQWYFGYGKGALISGTELLEQARRSLSSQLDYMLFYTLDNLIIEFVHNPARGAVSTSPDTTSPNSIDESEFTTEDLKRWCAIYNRVVTQLERLSGLINGGIKSFDEYRNWHEQHAKMFDAFRVMVSVDAFDDVRRQGVKPLSLTHRPIH